MTSQCGVIDDSTSSSGLSLTGNITLKATSIGVVGSSLPESGNITVSRSLSRTSRRYLTARRPRQEYRAQRRHLHAGGRRKSGIYSVG